MYTLLLSHHLMLGIHLFELTCDDQSLSVSFITAIQQHLTRGVQLRACFTETIAGCSCTSTVYI